MNRRHFLASSLLAIPTLMLPKKLLALAPVHRPWIPANQLMEQLAHDLRPYKFQSILITTDWQDDQHFMILRNDANRSMQCFPITDINAQMALMIRREDAMKQDRSFHFGIHPEYYDALKAEITNVLSLRGRPFPSDTFTFADGQFGKGWVRSYLKW